MVCCLALTSAPLAAIAEQRFPAPAPRQLHRPWTLAEGGAGTDASRPPSFVDRHRTGLSQGDAAASIIAADTPILIACNVYCEWSFCAVGSMLGCHRSGGQRSEIP
jgi:hypothetical protein